MDDHEENPVSKAVDEAGISIVPYEKKDRLLTYAILVVVVLNLVLVSFQIIIRGVMP